MRSRAVKLFINVTRLYHSSPNHKSENIGSMQLSKSALGYLRNGVISPRKKENTLPNMQNNLKLM